MALQVKVCIIEVAKSTIEEEKSSIEVAKSSVKVEVDHLNQAISLEKKKQRWGKDHEKELNIMLSEVNQKLSKVEKRAIDAEE